MVHLGLGCALLLLCFVCFVDLWLCPYSKVEESFPLQATHDLYYYGTTPAWQHYWNSNNNNSAESIATPPLLPYDHLEYPGVVPRSFVGPWILATLCRVSQRLVACVIQVQLDDHPLVLQGSARAWLLVLYLHGWYRLARALEHRQRGVGTATVLVTASQFHLTYYSSRMLPNIFATIVCLHAYAFWVRGQVPRAAIGLIVATAIFRCDVIILLFTAGLCWLIQRQLTIGQALRIGITTGFVALMVSVPLDTVLWQQQTPMWPEGHVFYYNAILGQSEAWGVSPWHWYLTSALPKALLGTFLLCPWSMLVERVLVGRLHKVETKSRVMSWSSSWWIPLVVTFVGFVALYSCLGHKEVRFLFPALPLANVVSGIGLSRLHTWHWQTGNSQKKKDDDIDEIHEQQQSPWNYLIRRWAYMIALGLLILSFVASTAFVAVSHRNYPGGTAMEHLASITIDIPSEQPCRIYIDNYAAMTGVSRFGQRTLPKHCVIEKAGYEENRSQSPLLFDGEDGVLLPPTHLVTEDATLGGKSYDIVATIPGHPRLNAKNFRVDTSDALYILERK